MAVKIEIRGNADFRRALRRFTPDLEKELKKEIGNALRPVVRQAKGFVPAQSPMSGWAGRSFSEGIFPTYNASTIINGITYKTTPSKINENGFSSMASIQNKSRVGAIYESAGRNGAQGQPWVGPKAGSKSNKVSKSSNPKAGEQFIKNLGPLTSSLKGRGRLIYRAWAENRGLAEGATLRAIDNAWKQLEIRQMKQPLKRVA
jgi:hypothetical protein